MKVIGKVVSNVALVFSTFMDGLDKQLKVRFTEKNHII